MLMKMLLERWQSWWAQHQRDLIKPWRLLRSLYANLTCQRRRFPGWKDADGGYFVRSRPNQIDCHQPKVLNLKLYYMPKSQCGTTILWQTPTYHHQKTMVGRNKTTDGYQWWQSCHRHQKPSFIWLDVATWNSVQATNSCAAIKMGCHAQTSVLVMMRMMSPARILLAKW